VATFLVAEVVKTFVRFCSAFRCRPVRYRNSWRVPLRDQTCKCRAEKYEALKRQWRIAHCSGRWL